MFGNSLICHIKSIKVVHSSSDEKWVWKTNQIGKATARGTYTCLRQQIYAPYNSNWYDWKSLWKIPVLPKKQLFFVGNFYTKDYLQLIDFKDLI